LGCSRYYDSRVGGRRNRRRGRYRPRRGILCNKTPILLSVSLPIVPRVFLPSLRICTHICTHLLPTTRVGSTKILLPILRKRKSTESS
jgi:hypothetical protein